MATPPRRRYRPRAVPARPCPPFDGKAAKEIVRLVRVGLTAESAAMATGGDALLGALAAWRQRGAEDAVGKRAGEPMSVYEKFEQDVKRAPSQNEADCVEMAKKLAGGDGKLALRLAAHVNPGWIERRAVEVTGAQGGPVEVIGVMEAERRKEAKARGEGGG